MRKARVWKKAAAGATLVAAALMVSAPASAAQAAVAAGPYAAVTGFATPQIVVFQGDALTFTNADTTSHGVSAKVFGPAGPLFASTLAGIGQSVPVEGVEALAPGNYPFVCTLHSSMTGTITVVAR